MMRIIGTIAPPHQRELMEMVTKHPGIYGFRFNTGARSPYNRTETLSKIVESGNSKHFWVDLKGRQLRVLRWAFPPYSPIELNHEFTVSLPATMLLRGNQRTEIRSVVGSKAFVYPPLRDIPGAGQAINVHGFLTPEDKEYIEAAKRLGIHDYMLSFVEEEGDMQEKLDSEAKMVLKIESPKGLQFVENIFPTIHMRQEVTLMAARDDLLENIGTDKTAMITALEMLIKRDPNAIAASHIMTSLLKSTTPAVGDISDVYMLRNMGYSSFMFSDSLSQDKKAFPLAMEAMLQFSKN